MANALEDITSALLTSGLFSVVGSIGSKSSREVDILVVGRGRTLYLDPSVISSEADELKRALRNLGVVKRAFLLDAHRSRADTPGAAALHLLYYPSSALLTEWELPSFLCDLYERAEWKVGDREILGDARRDYLARKVRVIGQTASHLARYGSLATVFYLYHRLAETAVGDAEEVLQKLAYAVRFCLMEYLNARVTSSRRTGAFDLKDLLSTARKSSEVAKQAASVLGAVRRCDATETDERAEQLFESFCCLYEACRGLP